MLNKTSKARVAVTVSGIILLAGLFLIGCGGGTAHTITEAGSTTVQPLAEKLANAFMEDHTDVKIIIQGGGSSTGVRSCNDGTADIGAASRELKSSEPALITHLLALDGIAIATHPSNSVDGLTTEQVKDVYAGTITNWSEVGGDDEDIVIIAREEGSGTRDAFEELVMDEELITSGAILQPSNGALRTSVAITPYSIGFLSFGYVDDSAKSLSIDGVAGTVENVKSGAYPIVRPLYFLTREEPTGQVKDFIDFCLSAEGQIIVEEEGYISAQ
ncbi:MAG: phosphate ABC transporter substrate-binding protein [Chloroflexota bacterium]|nr:phosphate ABC transporter substrate-binding protein [Chloroflexota bacterium]